MMSNYTIPLRRSARIAAKNLAREDRTHNEIQANTISFRNIQVLKVFDDGEAILKALNKVDTLLREITTLGSDEVLSHKRLFGDLFKKCVTCIGLTHNNVNNLTDEKQLSGDVPSVVFLHDLRKRLVVFVQHFEYEVMYSKNDYLTKEIYPLFCKRVTAEIEEHLP